MPVAGGNRPSYQAEIKNRRLITGLIELTMLPRYSVEDAIPHLLDGERVRVDAVPGKQALRNALLLKGHITE